MLLTLILKRLTLILQENRENYTINVDIIKTPRNDLVMISSIYHLALNVVFRLLLMIVLELMLVRVVRLILMIGDFPIVRSNLEFRTNQSHTIDHHYQPRNLILHLVTH